MLVINLAAKASMKMQFTLQSCTRQITLNKKITVDKYIKLQAVIISV